MSELQKIIGDYTSFLPEIISQVQARGFDLDDFSQMDHMCYRTVSFENYKAKQEALSSVADLLGETQVNDRPISTFRLHEPVLHEGWRVDAIELPAPKTGASHPEGLEHVEFVIFDDIATFLQKYKDQPFDLRAADRGINPEIGLNLGKYSVKFHLLALPVVVYLEGKLGIHDVRDGK